jgi:cytosine/adenosine deaminase-related metal-dependent hydrolase
MSTDPRVGDFATADVLVEGKKIVEVRPGIRAAGADVIDVRGRIVVPGFVTTSSRRRCAEPPPTRCSSTNPSGSPSAVPNHADYVLKRFAPAYRPQDVHISVLFSGLAQLDAGVTKVLDTSQIHHSPHHSDASIQALIDSGRRSLLQYCEGDLRAESRYPEGARRIEHQWFPSDDRLVSMAMGGEFRSSDEELYSKAWKIGREPGVQIATHVVSGAGVRPVVDAFARAPRVRKGPRGGRRHPLHPHDGRVRHGTPPILKMQELGMRPS